MPKEYPLTELEKKAWDFSKEKHDGQFRKFTGVPYFEHVRFVFKLVKKFDTREELGIAALLHDTLEDTDATPEEIREIFGDRVLKLVKELTSDSEMKDIMGKTDYLTDKLSTMSSDALIIKLCDRLQNISDHYNSDSKFLFKYFVETRSIINGLKSIRRDLNRTHLNIISLIEGITQMMGKRYRLDKKYKKFINRDK